MDQERQAVAAGLSDALSAGDKGLYQSVLGCLQSAKCQKQTGVCIGRGGPCEQRLARREARGVCRPLKMELLASARVDVCRPYVERMRPALLEQYGGDVVGVEQRMAELTNDCAAANVDKDKRYNACFFDALRVSLVQCAREKCVDHAAACATKQCGLKVDASSTP